MVVFMVVVSLPASIGFSLEVAEEREEEEEGKVTKRCAIQCSTPTHIQYEVKLDREESSMYIEQKCILFSAVYSLSSKYSSTYPQS